MNKLLMLSIFSVLTLLMLNVNMVSALGETKDIIAPTLTTPYGSVDIYNYWKLPLISSKLSTYTLLDNGDSVIDAWATGTATLYGKNTLFSNLEFNSRFKNLEAVDFKVYYNTKEDYTEDKINYKEVCIDDVKNGTKSCSPVEESREKITKTREVMKEYNGEELEAGTYTWRIEAKKPKANYALDWVAEAQGVKLDNWAWWSASWSKKKAILIQESTGNTWANYSVYLNVTYDSDMNVDFSDLRFIDSTESTELKYFIATKINSNSAQIWVKTELTANVNTTVYMYYGNAGASTTSNRTTAFLFDDDGSKDRTAEYSIGGTSATFSWSSGEYTFDASTTTATAYPTGFSSGNYTITTELKDTNIAYACGMTSRASGAEGNNAYKIQKVNGNIKAREVDVDLATIGTASTGVYFNATIWNFGTTINWSGQGATSGSHQATDTTYTTGYGGFWSYSEGNGCLFKNLRIRAYGNPEPSSTFGAETVTNNLIVTLNTPADNYNISTNSVTFNCSATDETGVLNLTLIIDGADNTTITGGVGQNLSLQSTKTLAEGSHTWNCRASDGSGSGDPATATTRNIYIDTIAPRINILYPTNNLEIQTFSVPKNVSFNVSITEAGYFSNCWYFNGTTNNTLTCGNNATVNLTGGYNTFIYYANDSVGNIGSNSTYFLVNYLQPSVNYSLTGVEGENTTIYLNLTANNITQANATINYNNTNYAMDIGSYNGTTSAFYKVITLPIVSADTIKQFNISYYINGIQYNTTLYNQTVYNIPSLNISSGLCSGTPVYWFSLQDEENLSTISGDYEYNFYYGLTNASMVRTYGKVTGATNFSICTNATISPNWTIGSGEILYSSAGYVDRRYYIFDNTVVTSATNLTLYDLLSTSQTSFKLEVEDTSLNPFKNIYTRLLRWYPDLNTYNIVDIGKTDETGSTVIHVRTEDVDYRIGAYYTNGSLIYLANPIRMVCLASPCTYTLKISPGETDYTSFLNIAYTFTYNETTGIWDFTYSDTTGKTSTMNLVVYRVTSTGDYIVCNSSISGAVGALSCNSSIYTTGILRGEVYRSASPPVVIVQKVIHLFTSAFKGSTFGLWLSMLLALPIIFLLSLVSPIGAILGGVIALIPALYFGSINIGIVGGIAVLGGIVAHFLKRVS